MLRILLPMLFSLLSIIIGLLAWAVWNTAYLAAEGPVCGAPVQFRHVWPLVLSLALPLWILICLRMRTLLDAKNERLRS